jgi:hypothetical protein
MDFVLQRPVSEANSEDLYSPQLSATLPGIDDLGTASTIVIQALISFAASG